MKWWWRLKTDPSQLWAREIKGIHKLRNKPSNVISTKAIPGVWSNVAGIKDDLKELGIDMDVVLVKHMGKGDNILFWSDQWIGTQPLKLVFPALYQLERYKTCRISDRIQVGQHTWRWKLIPSSADQVNELQSLSSLLGTF